MVFNKRAFIQMSFTWIFALIVGAFILFLAIFALTKFIDTEKTTGDLTSAKDISVLLSPLETSFEQGKITSLKAPTNSRIYSGCDLEGTFGHQQIVFNQEIYDKWSETNNSVDSQNKYLFLENPQEGKLFYLFSKPLNFPFKVGSLIYLTSAEKRYCFIDAPGPVEEEMENLGHPNIFIKDSSPENDCLGDEINVCFGSPYSCGEGDIRVDVGNLHVKKDGKTLYFALPKSGIQTKDYSLMYAAIFSDSSLYECQSKRLINRTISLIQLYEQKLLLPSLQNCNADLLVDLNNFETQLKFYDDTRDWKHLSEEAEDIWYRNKYNTCKIW